ncbi:hypothetical protein C8R46DRAFT_1354579 [Mycena filopes]|nr:hypothetical protein C8R46DRAFT_1354579 [Mycena filopes]
MSTSSATSQPLILSVPALSVLTYTKSPSSVAAGPPLNQLPIVLLCGNLSEFALYSRTERTAWLQDIAHDIVDPVNKSGTLWFQDLLTGGWSQPLPTDNLLSGTYEYRPALGVNFRLSKYSHRNNKSVTSATGAAADMRASVVARDAQCWITGAIAEYCSNSHICPKRMGDAMAGHIYQTFCGGSTTNTSIFNEVFGILLSKTLDSAFDVYKLGFRQIATNAYEVHNFGPHAQTLTIFATLLTPNIPLLPLLHGYHVQPPNPLAPNLPPSGLFRWQYMQCVLHKFGSEEYKQQPNIAHHELSFRTEDDIDDQFEDNDADWPSAAFDRGRAEASMEAEEGEKQARVAHWVQA